MSATGTPTTNIGLRIPLGTDPASVDDINYNSNRLDEVIGPVGNKALQDQVIQCRQDMAIVAIGNTHAAIASGQYVSVTDHSTLTDGLYQATAAIAANATLSGSNLTAVSGGGLNALNSKMAWTQIGSTTSSATISGYSASDYREILIMSKNGNTYVAQAVSPALSSGSVDAFYVTGSGDKRTASFNMNTKVLSTDNSSYQAILYAR